MFPMLDKVQRAKGARARVPGDTASRKRASLRSNKENEMLTEIQADLMAHALGLEKPGVWVEEPKRNNFAADPGSDDDRALSWLVVSGHCTVSPPREGFPYNLYRITDEGRRAVAVFGHVDAIGQPIHTWRGYVVEDATARGDCALFWRANRKGYTTDLLQAGRYTGIEVIGCLSSKKTSSERDDIAWPFDEIRKHVISHVSRDALYTARKR